MLSTSLGERQQQWDHFPPSDLNLLCDQGKVAVDGIRAYSMLSIPLQRCFTPHLPWQDCFQSKKSECCLSHLHHRSYMHPQILFKVDFWPDKQFDSGYCYCHRTSCGSSHFTLASCFALPNCRSHLWLGVPGSLHVNARALRIDFLCTLAPKQIGRQETAGVPTHLGRLVSVCSLHLWNASVDECLILVGEA